MDKLLDMLTYRRPAGSETEFEFLERFILCDPRAVMDEHRNIIICTSQASRTLFSCHTDTVHRAEGRQQLVCDANLGVIYKSDGDPLGADDGAGVWLMLEMIAADVPGTYIFHYGEERGGIGSSAKAGADDVTWFNQFDRAVAFDRRGTGDVITHQGWGRCCSDKFAEELAAQLNLHGMDYAPNAGGIFTDTANYTELIPECTNLSVGYDGEHTKGETQDVFHLLALRDAVIRVDWEALPVVRVAEPSYAGYGALFEADWPPSGGGGSRFNSSADLLPEDQLPSFEARAQALAEFYGYDAEGLAELVIEMEDELRFERKTSREALKTIQEMEREGRVRGSKRVVTGPRQRKAEKRKLKRALWEAGYAPEKIAEIAGIVRLVRRELHEEAQVASEPVLKQKGVKPPAAKGAPRVRRQDGNIVSMAWGKDFKGLPSDAECADYAG